MPSGSLTVGVPSCARLALALALCGVAIALATCGPATPESATPSAQPAASAPAPVAATAIEPGAPVGQGSEEVPEPGETSQPVVTAPPRNQHLSNVVLWCSTPKGSACERAAAELQLTPTATDQVPEPLLTNIQDNPDDCSDAQIAALARRVTDALALEWDRWHSHIGMSLSRTGIQSIYQGAGCVSCCDPQDPSAKIHAVYMDERKGFLVRVWEAGVN